MSLCWLWEVLLRRMLPTTLPRPLGDANDMNSLRVWPDIAAYTLTTSPTFARTSTAERRKSNGCQLDIVKAD